MNQTENTRHTITMAWTQRGHSIYDPCGHNTYRMRATWAVVGTVEEAVKELHKAERYCQKQQNWTDWEVSRD